MLNSLILIVGLLAVVLLILLILIIVWQSNQIKAAFPNVDLKERRKLFLISSSELTLLRVIREVVRKGDISFLDEITELAFNKARLQSSERAGNKALDDDTEFFK